MSKLVIKKDVDVHLIDSMGDDASIVQAARVSVKGANEVYEVEGVYGLINYLMREKHGSPFEQNALKFYVKAPIFVFREFQRHRIASYNEISGRYTKLEGEFYIPGQDRHLINIGTSARPDFIAGGEHEYWDAAESMLEVYQVAWKRYEEMIENGIANEVARMVLPVGIFSQMYVTMNLRSIFNFLSLRIQCEEAVHVSRPQREIEMVAEQIEAIVAQLFPMAHGIFNRHGRVAP